MELNLELSKALADALKKLANSEGMSVAAYLKRLAKEHVAEGKNN